MSAIGSPPAALIRAIALRHATGRDDEVKSILNGLSKSTLSQMEEQLFFLYEVVKLHHRMAQVDDD